MDGCLTKVSRVSRKMDGYLTKLSRVRRKFAAEHREKLAARRAESNAEKMKQMDIAKAELEKFDAQRKVLPPHRTLTPPRPLPQTFAASALASRSLPRMSSKSWMPTARSAPRLPSFPNVPACPPPPPALLPKRCWVRTCLTISVPPRLALTSRDK